VTDRIEVIIVDDQPRARQSLRALLATSSVVGSVREAATGVEALQLLEEACPDLVVMDARMPELDGIAATRLIKTKWPSVRVVVLSMYPEYQNEALTAGADAFVMKGDPQVQILSRLAQVTLGAGTAGVGENGAAETAP
jgi:DNA-binding NarL/FixJ family response regulator